MQRRSLKASKPKAAPKPSAKAKAAPKASASVPRKVKKVNKKIRVAPKDTEDNSTPKVVPKSSASSSK